MPGINLLCDFERKAAKSMSLYLEALNDATCDVDYGSNIFLENESLILSYTKYQRYPVSSFENEQFRVILEGKIYNKQGSDLEEHLFVIAEMLFKGGGYCKEKITEWLFDSDGEFNVFILNKTSGNVKIINDVIGRLPIYYSTTENQFILSRHQDFVTSTSGQRQCDRLGLAEFLLLGYCLGDRTLVEGVRCLSPASVISIDLQNCKADINIIHTYDFERMKKEGAKSSGDIDKLISLVVESFKRRAENQEGQTNVLSLSGGLDSRIIAGLFDYCKIPFSAMTHLDPNNIYVKESQVSGEIAQLLNAERKVIKISKLKGANVLRMLKLKSGICPISKGFIIDYFIKIKEFFGENTILFDGDGGATMIYPIPAVAMRNLNDLVESKRRKERLFSFEEVDMLTGVSKEKIISDIKKITDSYPEKSWTQKWLHFYLYGKTFRRWNDGGDRSRTFTWATSPLWSVNIFRYIMSWPDKSKKNQRIHERILNSVCPALNTIVYSNTGKLPGSNAKLRTRFLKWLRQLPNPVRFVYKQYRKGFSVHDKECFVHNEALIKCMTSQMDNSDAVKAYMSDNVIREIIANNNKYSRKKIATLFTAMSMAEYVTNRSSSLEQYLEDDFSLLGEF